MNELRDKIAKELARAYWRGRLETLRASNFEDGVFERMIQEAGEADFERWRQTALTLMPNEKVSDGR